MSECLSFQRKNILKPFSFSRLCKQLEDVSNEIVAFAVHHEVGEFLNKLELEFCS